MKIIKNNIIPFKGFDAINLFGFIFTRKEISEKTINHEYIHTAQMKELLYIFFYIIYGIEWLIRFIISGNSFYAYNNISFEKEAYKHQKEFNYVDWCRKPFAMWRK